jgi:DNA polymerase-1
MPEKMRLFLVDGTALAYRGYFAFIKNPLINSRGENTSAPFAFTNSLFKLIREFAPTHLAVVFDAPGRTFRHERYSDYKATREKMPDDLAQTLPRVHQVVAAMAIPILQVAGYEADDVLATLARQGSGEGMEVFLVSGDKDMMQCLSERVHMLRPGRRGDEWQLLEVEDVRGRYGVEPARVTDVLGLMGDASDNVPGVPGVGEKTAVRLIREYGSLEGVLAGVAGLNQPRLRESLLQHADQAKLSKQLVTLDREVPLPVEARELVFRGFDRPRLIELFNELEFSALVRELLREGGAEETESEYLDYRLITDPGSLEEVLAVMGAAPIFAVDLETTGLDPHQARVVGVSLAVEPGRAYYLPLRHAHGPNLEPSPTLERLRGLIEDPEHPKAGHNIKYDALVLRNEGIELRGIAFDTMVASYLLNPARRQHGLDSLALEYLQHQPIPITSLIGTGKDQISFAEVLTDEAAEYSCEDADLTVRLMREMAPKLEALELSGLFESIEVPLIPILVEMESKGVLVDLDLLGAMGREFERELVVLEEEIHRLAGGSFNVNSPQQLQEVLFDRLDLPRGRRTKTGWSTDSEVLEGLVAEHPIAAKLLDYRSLSKLKSTYIDALPRLLDERTGRIHTSFNQTVAATGRLSSSEPNLQNIPVRTEAGRRIRRAFIAPPGRVLLSADYSQIELRIMAHLSRDERLIEAFRRGEDVHASTAAVIFDRPISEVTEEQRRQAKTVNFGVMYGMGAVSLGKQLGIPSAEAKDFIENYFERFQGVTRYIEETREAARRNGFVTTLLNRRRYLPELESGAHQIRAFAERTAVNTPIQGSAADLIKLAMIAVHDWIGRESVPADMLIQVHDELVFEVDEEAVATVRDRVMELMAGALRLDVPVVVEAAWGFNWAEAH